MSNLLTRSLLCRSCLLPIFSLTIFTILFPSFSLAEEEKKFELTVYLTKKQALELAFPGADEIKKERQWLSKKQTRAIEDLYMYKIYEIS